MKAAITERALCQRINRKLRSRGKVLKHSRGNLWTTLGDYYLVDLKRNFIAEHHINPEELGRELEALAPYETVEG